MSPTDSTNSTHTQSLQQLQSLYLHLDLSTSNTFLLWCNPTTPFTPDLRPSFPLAAPRVHVTTIVQHTIVPEYTVASPAAFP